MRVLSLLAAVAALLAFTAAGKSSGLTAPAGASSEAAANDAAIGVAETQPAAKPAPKPKPVDDEVKALSLRPMKVGTAMDKLKAAKAEGKIKGWSESGAKEFDDVRKTGVLIAAMCKTVEWKKEKKRDKDARAFDQMVVDLDAAAHKLAEAGGARDPAAVKAAAGEVNQRCSECHAKFK